MAGKTNKNWDDLSWPLPLVCTTHNTPSSILGLKLLKALSRVTRKLEYAYSSRHTEKTNFEETRGKSLEQQP